MTMKERAHLLLRNLFHELFQTETSAVRHCRREADRLGVSPPAHALRQVADHAEQVIRELPGLANMADMPVSTFGKATGAVFSQLRDKLADRFIHEERSYRGTLLGVRHGLDLVALMKQVAAQAGDDDIAAYCERWQAVRAPLVEQMASELAWFGSHPELSLRRSKRVAREATLDQHA